MPGYAKIRADELLAQLGLAPSRSAAQQLIKDGRVMAADQVVRKPGQFFSADTILTLKEDTTLYVSRGAGKLLAALEAFHPVIADKVALDLGASTGGFTDVLLRNGAARVYAVDVGTDQLHPSLRSNPKVISLEQTNAKDLNQTLIPEPIQILTGDLSFISLTKVLAPCCQLLAPNFMAMLLIKPQFEAERKDIGSGGVVRSQAVRQQCIEKVVSFAENTLHWHHLGTIPSPVLGPNGNQEYIAAFNKL